MAGDCNHGRIDPAFRCEFPKWRKTLILTVMAIFGAKNVNLDKVMKYALWEKVVLTVGTLTLAATG